MIKITHAGQAGKLAVARVLGGALADRAGNGGAFSRTEGAYCYYALAVPADEQVGRRRQPAAR